jgi:hypothetical protein
MLEPKTKEHLIITCSLRFACTTSFEKELSVGRGGHLNFTNSKWGSIGLDECLSYTRKYFPIDGRKPTSIHDFEGGATSKILPGGFSKGPPGVLEFCNFFPLKGVSKQGPCSLFIQLDIGIILYLLINFCNFFSTCLEKVSLSGAENETSRREASALHSGN